MMKAYQTDGRTSTAAWPVGWVSQLNADGRVLNLRRAAVTVLPSWFRMRGTSCFFCVGVWLSSLVAIWMSRGWVGLFLSGQVLSAGAWLFEGMAKRTERVVRRIESTEPFEGVRHEL